MNITVKMTYLGIDTGPNYNVIAYPSGSVIASGVSRATLLAGVSYSVPDDTNILRIDNTGGICPYYDMVVDCGGTTTTTALPPTSSTTTPPPTSSTTSTTTTPPPTSSTTSTTLPPPPTSSTTSTTSTTLPPPPTSSTTSTTTAPPPTSSTTTAIELFLVQDVYYHHDTDTLCSGSGTLCSSCYYTSPGTNLVDGRMYYDE